MRSMPNTAGQRKGLILIGHWVSEDQGMRLCADWLKSFVTEVPVKWIPAGDPFWRPEELKETDSCAAPSRLCLSLASFWRLS